MNTTSATKDLPEEITPVITRKYSVVAERLISAAVGSTTTVLASTILVIINLDD